MKAFFNTIAIAIALFLAPATSNASTNDFQDEPKNEISVSLGELPATAILDVYTNSLAFASCDLDGDIESSVALNVDYTRRVNKWLNLGVLVNYGRTKFDCVNQDNTPYGVDKIHSLSVLPTAKFNWFRREHVTMYSRLSLGLTYQHDHMTYNDQTKADYKNDDAFLNMQVSPFGIEAGSSHVRAFTELGLGQAGMLQFGIRFRF